MAKNHSKNQGPEQAENALVIKSPWNPAKLTRTPEQASRLLESLGKTYRTLCSREQKQVKAFFRDYQTCSHSFSLSEQI